MTSKTGETDRNQYKAWFDKYMARTNSSKYGAGTNFTAEDCWNFRCAILHQGHSSHIKMQYKRILFIEPPLPNFGIHCCMIGAKSKNKSLLIDLKVFCLDIITSANKWLEENENSDIFKKNYQYLIRRHPKGLAPVQGCPVIG